MTGVSSIVRWTGRPARRPAPFESEFAAGRLSIAVGFSIRVGQHWCREKKVPSLIRFLVTIAVLAGLVWGGLWALATFVEPNQREMTVRIPANKLAPK
jgi:hypothetical protein